MKLVGIMLVLAGLVVSFGTGAAIKNSLRRMGAGDADEDFKELLSISSKTFKVIGLIMVAGGVLLALVG